MSAAKHRRSTCGASEHSLSDSACGNIGITRVGKYTDVPRSFASVVDGRARPHVVTHVRDRDDQPETSSGCGSA